MPSSSSKNFVQVDESIVLLVDVVHVMDQAHKWEHNSETVQA